MEISGFFGDDDDDDAAASNWRAGGVHFVMKSSRVGDDISGVWSGVLYSDGDDGDSYTGDDFSGVWYGVLYSDGGVDDEGDAREVILSNCAGGVEYGVGGVNIVGDAYMVDVCSGVLNFVGDVGDCGGVLLFFGSYSTVPSTATHTYLANISWKVTFPNSVTIVSAEFNRSNAVRRMRVGLCSG